MSVNTILFDMNSIGHAAHAGPKLNQGDLYVQGIFGGIRSVRAAAENYEGWRLWGLWDGDASWRKELYPEYKANRKVDAEADPKRAAEKEDYKKQMKLLRQILPFLGIKQCMVLNGEADDLGGYLSRQITSKGGSVVLFTGDQDWLQMVNERCMWIDPIRDRRVSLPDFLDKTGYFTPREFLEGKALQGDGSDNIGGVGGIGETGARELLAKYRSVADFLSIIKREDIKGKKLLDFHSNTTGGQDKFFRNLKLMNLIDVPKPDADKVIITPSNYNEEHFKKVCQRLGFQSILRDFDRFMRPFRNQYQILGEAA